MARLFSLVVCARICSTLAMVPLCRNLRPELYDGTKFVYCKQGFLGSACQAIPKIILWIQQKPLFENRPMRRPRPAYIILDETYPGPRLVSLRGIVAELRSIDKLQCSAASPEIFVSLSFLLSIIFGDTQIIFF